MPLSGILKGDFSSFIDAVNKAEVSLKNFEGDAGKVQTALNKMGDSFSGKKVIADAELAAKAVTEIGGATKLTANEQARLNAQLNEAIAKYTALGSKAPPEMVALANATKQVETATVGVKTSTSDMLGTLGKVAGAVGIGFSVGAVVNFAGKVFDTASHIKDLSDKLGVSTDAIQGFSFAAAQGGSDIDAVGASLEKMNEKLSAGEKGTVGALKDLGIKFSDIRNMKPEDAFLAITDQIAKIQDPMDQARLAVELFGKRGAELLPSIRDGFRDTSDAAAKMSNETIKSLEHAQQAWENLANKVIILTGNMIASAQDATSSWEKFAEFVAVKSGTISAEALKIQQDTDRIARALALAPVKKPDINLPAASPKKTADELKAEEDARLKAAAAVQKHADAVKQLMAAYSGKAAIDAAALSIEAVNAAGKAGITISKMTYEQQQAINKTLAAALDAYKAQGKVAPEALRAVYAATLDVTKLIPDLQKLPSNIRDIGEAAGDVVAPLVYMDGITQEMFDKMGKHFTILPPQVKKLKVDFGDLSTALAQLAQISGSTFGGMVSSLSTLVGAANTAQKSIDLMRKGASEKGSLAGILDMASGITGVVSAAIAAGQAVVALFKLFNQHKGRDVVVDFAETFGGFDALHVKLLELGADGEALWIKLTQGVGRNNPAQAQKVIDEVTQALDEQAKKSDDAKSATEEQAQATIETATEAAKALDELGPKIDESAQQWKDWGAVVTGVLQEIANSIRALPVASPGGSLPFSAGSGGGSSSFRLDNNLYLDGKQIAENTAYHLLN